MQQCLTTEPPRSLRTVLSNISTFTKTICQGQHDHPKDSNINVQKFCIQLLDVLNLGNWLHPMDVSAQHYASLSLHQLTS